MRGRIALLLLCGLLAGAETLLAGHMAQANVVASLLSAPGADPGLVLLALGFLGLRLGTLIGVPAVLGGLAAGGLAQWLLTDPEGAASDLSPPAPR